MKMKYLGTGAAEGIPAMFCECKTCMEARRTAGKNIRTRSQALVDGKLLIDFPADTYVHSIQYGINLATVKSCLITHSHSDHLYPADIEMRKPGFSHIDTLGPLTFYSGKSGCDMLKAEAEKYNVGEDRVRVEQIELFKPFKVEEYTVTALRATHGVDTSPVVFLIERDGRTLFYSNDTSEYPSDTMDYLRTYGKHIDLLSLDCTEANGACTYAGHLTLSRCVELVNNMKYLKIIDNDTRVVLNHFSHNGVSVLYDDFVKLAGKYGYEVSYDGMEIEI